MTENTGINLEDKTEVGWRYDTDTNSTFICIAKVSLVKIVRKTTSEWKDWNYYAGIKEIGQTLRISYSEWEKWEQEI